MTSSRAILQAGVRRGLLVALVVCLHGPALATPLLGSALGGFAVLGASTVTNTGPTTISGNLGVSPGTALTGSTSITLTGTYHIGTDAVGVTAQNALAGAITALGGLKSTALEPADLAALTLAPGIYTVPAGISNLTGTLTLNGGGNANAAWVFLMPSTLITSPGAVVQVLDTGSGAGIFWDVGSSATLGTTTSFQGNILARASITLDHAASIGCGRALAQTGAVTMDSNTINATDCLGSLGAGSDGFGGGLDLVGSVVDVLPAAAVAEPASLALLGGAIGLLTAARRRRAVAGFRRSEHGA